MTDPRLQMRIDDFHRDRHDPAELTRDALCELIDDLLILVDAQEIETRELRSRLGSDGGAS